MEMQKGVAVFERDDVKTSAIFLDHEVVEFARQNAKTKKNIAKAKETDNTEEIQRRRAEKAEARRLAFTIKTVRSLLSCGGIICGEACGGAADMIHPAIYIPVIVACLCVACLRCGLWLGRMGRV